MPNGRQIFEQQQKMARRKSTYPIFPSSAADAVSESARDCSIAFGTNPQQITVLSFPRETEVATKRFKGLNGKSRRYYEENMARECTSFHSCTLLQGQISRHHSSASHSGRRKFESLGEKLRWLFGHSEGIADALATAWPFPRIFLDDFRIYVNEERYKIIERCKLDHVKTTKPSIRSKVLPYLYLLLLLTLFISFAQVRGMEQSAPTPTGSSANVSITSASSKTNPISPSAQPTPVKRPHRYASGHTASAPIFGRAELTKGNHATNELYMGEKLAVGTDADEYEEVEYYEEYEESPDGSSKPPEAMENEKSEQSAKSTSVPLPPR
ncbi:hypothetical protein DdX_13372 [Ditylenchus destructor]|uniref:Uncharacterized protein n=1 Tax=Ditylenchus destructor TaxID=166010 RepID=A0AAD4MW47_9BILA|nr:hypothetical protein DdX_13372 [Ditylenchus destructor]